MERLEIIRRCLAASHQLTNDALEFLLKNQELLENFFKILREGQTPATIDVDYLKRALNSSGARKFTTEDYANIFSKRFEIIKKIFSQRGEIKNLISISKISQKSNKISIMGMVKDVSKDEGTITLEDKTGETEIRIEDKEILNDIVPDEVVAVLCENHGNGIIGETVFFPDIPMKREIERTKEDFHCLFISDLHMDSDLFNEKYYKNLINWLEETKEKINIFVVGDISSKTEDVMKFLSDIPKKHPVTVIEGEIDPKMGNILTTPVEIQFENVKLFLFHAPSLNHYVNLWGSSEKAMTNLMKKRHLDPIFAINQRIDNNDPYLLEKIPDIVVGGHTHIPSSTNYKGTTLLTTGSLISQPIFWLINLRTREIFKKDFS
jgi:DNA polymerase II small subunit/DNA polymerase delta subunit B